MKTILITGANGFVGSNLIEKSVQLGFKTIGIVRKTSDLTFIKKFLKKIELFYGDIIDKDSIREAFKKNIDYVVHTAAYASDWGKYEYFYNVNVIGTKNICELCLEYNVKHLIHISSISVYGFDTRIDADEKTPVIKNNFYYCKTKLEAEEVVEHFIKVFNLKATILQPGVIYGKNDRTTFYKIIEALLNNKMAMGDSGRHLLSSLYIDNLVNAILLVIKKPKKSIGKKYIVTDNVKITWKEFLNIFCKYLNVNYPKFDIPRWLGIFLAFVSESIYKLLKIKQPPLITAYRASLVTSDFHFSCKKIMKELGYKPLNDIEKNVKNTIESYFEYKKRI